LANERIEGPEGMLRAWIMVGLISSGPIAAVTYGGGGGAIGWCVRRSMGESDVPG